MSFVESKRAGGECDSNCVSVLLVMGTQLHTSRWTGLKPAVVNAVSQTLIDTDTAAARLNTQNFVLKMNKYMN